MDKVQMRLTNPVADPWTHVELPVLDENGQQVYDEADNPRYQEFHAGDVIEVTPDTAEHLELSRQAERVINQGGI